MIYHSGFEKTLNNDSLPFFNLLRKVGIVYKTPEEAAKFLNMIDKDSVERWWNNQETQNALKKFTDFYVKKDHTGLNILINKLSAPL